jgi:hypothetical protein
MPKPVAKDKPTFSSVTLPDGSLMIVRLNGVNEAATPTKKRGAIPSLPRFARWPAGLCGLPQAAGKPGGHQAFLMPD